VSFPDTQTDVVVEFLRSKNPDLDTIDPELDLIESRILDSLQFVEFMLLLEEATGHEIPLEQVSAEDFRTLSAIRARFFSEPR
jgi:acyl carrier protein